MISKRFHRGFTLIEVLIAMAVMATLSAGLLATTWRLSGFARDEAERLVADNFAHDLMRAVYNQSFSNIVDIAETAIDTNSLPSLISTDALGQARGPIYPLWRSQDISYLPSYEVKVTEVKDSHETSKQIHVTIYWWIRGERKSYSPVDQVRPIWGDGT